MSWFLLFSFFLIKLSPLINRSDIIKLHLDPAQTHRSSLLHTYIYFTTITGSKWSSLLIALSRSVFVFFDFLWLKYFILFFVRWLFIIWYWLLILIYKIILTKYFQPYEFQIKLIILPHPSYTHRDWLTIL